MNQGVNVSWFVLFHLVTKVVILFYHKTYSRGNCLCSAVHIKKSGVREEKLTDCQTKQNKHPIHYLVTISRTVANNIFFNLLKKMELTLKIKVLLLFFVTSAELELILIYTKTQKVRQHTTIID